MASPSEHSAFAHTSRTLILATGGTIAGSATSTTDNVGYRAGELSPEALLAAVPALQGLPLATRQLAQIDSKDMSHTLWWQLARAVDESLQQPDVGSVVITHGTDTLEETGYWLHCAVQSHKPVVLTAAMRPATSLQADGPQNLLDAVTLARSAGVSGVLAMVAGRVHAAHELRKVHNYRVDAFSSGEAGPLAVLEEGRLRALRNWPKAPDSFASLRAVISGPAPEPDHWPWVEIVHSHAGVDGRAVKALVQAGVQGLVVAATGNGTVNDQLLNALREAESAGVAVMRSTRCALGYLVADGQWPPGASGLTPAQARVHLLCLLLQAQQGRLKSL